MNPSFLGRIVGVLVLLSLAVACADTPDKAPIVVREGFIPVEGGPVWYQVFGQGKQTPLLILHGGPGSQSCVFQPLAEILSRDRPVILYDQLGSGRSGRPNKAELWNIDRFLRELREVRRVLGLQKVHLMGHSWGSGLATAYAGQKRTKGIESLTLAGPFLSTRLWLEDANRLRQELPADVQSTLQRHELAGTTSSKEYLDAAEVFYSRFLYHKGDPTPAGPCEGSKENMAVYQSMWGPTEFHCTGTLKTFDVTHLLPSLRMPVLLTVGRFDEARPETAARFQSQIPGAKLEILEECAHMAPAENPQAYARVLQTFLSQADAR